MFHDKSDVAPDREILEPHSKKIFATEELLSSYSVEVLPDNLSMVQSAIKYCPKNHEVFIASLPKTKASALTRAVRGLKKAGLIPTPHIVARNIADRNELTLLLGALSDEGVDRALIVGGDRDVPKGNYESGLDLLDTDQFQSFGFSKLYFGVYPESHPRINDRLLAEARAAKINYAQSAGIDVGLITQFCFDYKLIVDKVSELRDFGIDAPVRVGVAGPASSAALLKYAMLCGVGPSVRFIREKSSSAKNMFAGGGPLKVLQGVATAQNQNPDLNISAAHFFTFGSIEKTFDFIRRETKASGV